MHFPNKKKAQMLCVCVHFFFHLARANNIKNNRDTKTASKQMTQTLAYKVEVYKKKNNRKKSPDIRQN